MSSQIAEAAAFLAQKWMVIPCDENKRALLKDWPSNATSDPDEARRMFSRSGVATIGVKTGPDADLAVVDLDIKHGAPGLEWLEANRARLPRTREHTTRSGGRHLLFRYPMGRTIRNSASKIAPGVDIRGINGYVVFPPSPGYAITDDAMPAEMPGWLLDLIDPPQVERPQAPAAPARILPRDEGGTAYGLSGLERECAAIRNAPDGAKHDTLNRAAYSIGGLVAARQVEEGLALRELRAALEVLRPRCDDFAAAEKTLRTAFVDGMAQPRQAPPPRPEWRPTIRVEIIPPEAPPYEQIPEHWAAAPEPDMAADAGERAAERIDPETGEILTDGEHLKDRPHGLPIVRFDNIAPVLDTSDFVQGLLVDGSAAVVYGESNAGKTFWTTDLALHVAAGMNWNGRRVEQGGVAYAVLEGGFGFRNRVAAWRACHIKDGRHIPFVAIPASLNLLDPNADTPRLIAAVKAEAERMGCPVKLVVVDTLSRAMAGGNENAPDDMGALVRNMDLIRQETGACVLFIHHSGKDAAKGARGHSLLRAALDTEIEVKAEEGSDLKSATTVKQREMRKGDVFAFTLATVKLGENRHGEDVTTCVVKSADPAGIPEKRPRLSGGAHAALKALREALAKMGQTVTMRDIPENVPVVPVEAWRREFYARSTLETQEARKKAFQRAVRDLIDASAAAVLHERAWVVRD